MSSVPREEWDNGMPHTFDAQAFEREVSQIITALDASYQRALTTQMQGYVSDIQSLTTIVAELSKQLVSVQKQLHDQQELIGKLDAIVSKLEGELAAQKKAGTEARFVRIETPVINDVESETESGTQPIESSQLPAQADVEDVIRRFQNSPGYQALQTWLGKMIAESPMINKSIENVFTKLRECKPVASTAAVHFTVMFFCLRAAKILDSQKSSFHKHIPALLRAPAHSEDASHTFKIDRKQNKTYRLASFWSDNAFFTNNDDAFLSFFASDKHQLKLLIDSLETNLTPEGRSIPEPSLWKTYLEPAFAEISSTASNGGNAL